MYQEMKEQLCHSSTVGEWLGNDNSLPLSKVKSAYEKVMLKISKLSKAGKTAEEIRERYPALVEDAKRLTALKNAVNKAISIYNQMKAYNITKNASTYAVWQSTLKSYEYLAKEEPMLVATKVTLNQKDERYIIVTTNKWARIKEVERFINNPVLKQDRGKLIEDAKKIITEPTLTLAHG